MVLNGINVGVEDGNLLSLLKYNLSTVEYSDRPPIPPIQMVVRQPIKSSWLLLADLFS